jgi:5'(3')-deoxyribonucleotidase
MDGTINHFDAHFINYVKDNGYEFDDYDFNHNGDWDISKFIITSENQKKIMNDICTMMEFWDSIPPIKEAIPIVKELYLKYNVIIATIPWVDTLRYKRSKVLWMKKYFPFIARDHILFVNKKWELDGDIIIEDKPDTLDKCKESMYTICHNRPYNKNCNADYRFSNWNQIPKIIRTIEKEAEAYM